MPKQAARTNRKNTQLPKSSGKDLPLSHSTRAIDAEEERDLNDARRALKESQQKGAIPWEQVKRELGI